MKAMVVAGGLCGLLLTGCSGSAPAGRAAGAHGAKAGVATQRPLDPRVDPLTGTRPRRTRPVVVIKVDNETLARPYQRGLGPAALIYQELMEGGATRLLAVYDDASPAEVGPIRSVRESDLELLRQFGRVAVGFSGANSGVKATFRAGVAAHQVLDASYDAVPGAYRIGEHRSDANNFFTAPAKLAAARPKATRAQDVGLRFGKGATGPATRSARAAFSAGALVDLRYDARTARYSVRQDGHLMPGVAPSNVVVQFVRERSSRYADVLGHGTPYTVTLGRGRAVVLTGGRRVLGTWRRAGRGPIRYLDAGGRDVLLRPGQTWILLLPAGRPLTYG